MTNFPSSRFLIWFCIYVTLVVAATDQVRCGRRKCSGPLGHYADLNYTPVYEEGDKCCAVKYNCSHLKNISRNKCYVNGRVYEIGERLRAEDTNPCEINCRCLRGKHGVVNFHCKSDDWDPGFFTRNKRNNKTCINVRSPLGCYGREICVKGDILPICSIGGRTYISGMIFPEVNEPYTFCTCRPWYRFFNYSSPYDYGKYYYFYVILKFLIITIPYRV